VIGKKGWRHTNKACAILIGDDYLRES